MKKKKLNLSDLKVQSFVTKLNWDSTQTIIGGTQGNGCGTVPDCTGPLDPNCNISDEINCESDGCGKTKDFIECLESMINDC